MAEARSEEEDENMTRDTREQQAARRQSNGSGGKSKLNSNGENGKCVVICGIGFAVSSEKFVVNPNTDVDTPARW